MLGELTTDVSDMYTVHHAIVGALDTAPALIERAADDAGHAHAVGSFFENVLEFLHVHHEGEDELIYPKLKERCADAWATIDQIDQQHELVHQPTRDAIDALAAWRAEPTELRTAAAVAALARVDEVVKPHLALEETVVLPYCARWITQEEWSELPGHAMQAFGGDKIWVVLGLIRDQLTAEQWADMHAHLPPPVQTLWDQEWGATYDAFMEQVRR